MSRGLGDVYKRQIINLPQSDQGYLTIGVKNEYFKPIHQATIRLIFADLGIAFLLGTIASIYFAYRRSHPIERILHIIHDMDRQPNVQNSFLEIEGTVYQILEFQHVKPGKGAAFAGGVAGAAVGNVAGHSGRLVGRAGKAAWNHTAGKLFKRK